MNDLTTLLSQGLNIHLNIGQQFSMKTPAVFMSSETLSANALMNKEIHFVDNARVLFPSTANRSVNGTARASLRVRFFFLSLTLKITIFSPFSPLSNLWLPLGNRIRISPRRSRWLYSIKMEINFLLTPRWNFSFLVIQHRSFHRCSFRMSLHFLLLLVINCSICIISIWARCPTFLFI